MATTDGPDPLPPMPLQRGRRSGRHGLRWNLRTCFTDGVVFSIMVGIGENALGPFVLAMHPDAPVAAGLVTSVPLVIGAILQLLAPRVVHAFQSHKKAVVLFSCMQAMAFLPLAAGAMYGKLPLPLIFACAALYWGGGLGAGAAWNTWAATIVPTRIRARYFGRRSRSVHAGVLAGLIAGGLLLQSVDKDSARYAFAVMFLIAGLCRFYSARLQYSQSEPIPMPPDHRRVGVRDLIGRLGHGPDARLLGYMVAMQITINLAQPFFIPYALKQVQLEYASYFLLIAAPYAARMMAFPFFGQLAHRAGARWLIWIGGVGLIPISGLWMLSGNLGWLLLVQFGAGLAWAAYELGTFLMIWETVAEGERTSIMTTFNLANAGANTGGGLIGGQILESMGKDLGAYQGIFAISLVARLATLILLIRLQQMVAARATVAPEEQPPAAPAPGAPSTAAERPPRAYRGTSPERHPGRTRSKGRDTVS